MKSRILTCITAMTLLSSLAMPLRLASQSNAQGLKYTVLYTFTGGADGAVPEAALIQDEAGNLYGTASVAGDLSACVSGSNTGCGVVFKVDPSGNETVLYSFTGFSDGVYPWADLVRDEEGNLYGTTSVGGDSSCLCGVVFKVDPVGNYNVLYRFTGVDGKQPYAGLVRDENGNLYGTTEFGGSGCGGVGCGVVFKLDPNGNETVLHGFTGQDGQNPTADLVRDQDGNLYGTTYNGGASNAGVVFKLDATGHETFLYSFTGGADGANPYGGLVRDTAGNLYGAAGYGGACGFCGVVFRLDPTGKETVLYSFTGGADGKNPLGALVRDKQGNLYGTTYEGGDFLSGPCAGFGCGVVFKLDPNGNETVLYTFTGMADGGLSQAGLLRDKNGNLYGTNTTFGDLGSLQGWCAGIGCGVVFKITACRTARCQGGGDSDDNAEGATTTTNPANFTQRPSTVAGANLALSNRGTLDRLGARRFPSYRPLVPATGPMN